MINFLCQIKILLLNMKKIFRIPGFLMFFVQNSWFCPSFFKISFIPSFYSFFWPKQTNSRFFYVLPGFQVKCKPWQISNIYTTITFLRIKDYKNIENLCFYNAKLLLSFSLNKLKKKYQQTFLVSSIWKTLVIEMRLIK